MRRALVVWAALGMALGVGVTEARADAIGIYGTGVDAQGNVLPVGSADPHWTITALPATAPLPPGSPAVVAQAFFPAYIPNDAVGFPGSSWIAPSNSTGSHPIGNYTYRTTFDLTGLDPATARVGGSFCSDNGLVSVTLNGAPVPITGGGFAFYTPFSITSGFQDGVNTLDFVVQNVGSGNNPHGFRLAIVPGQTTADPKATDTTAPVISGADDRSFEYTGTAIVLTAGALGISAEDDVDGDVEVVLDTASVGLGVHTVTATAVDAAGNVAEAVFVVTVADTTAPALLGVANATFEYTGSDLELTPALLGITAEDTVDGDVGVSLSPSQVGLGTHTVTASATDAAGNTASSTFTVVVEDTTAPVFTSVQASSDTYDAKCNKLVEFKVSAQVSDAGDASPKVKIVGVSSDEAPKKGEVDWKITGDLTVELRATRDGKGDGRTYTITVEATDDQGNVSQTTLTVDIAHDRRGDHGSDRGNSKDDDDHRGRGK